jgi:hypothetical protein
LIFAGWYFWRRRSRQYNNIDLDQPYGPVGGAHPLGEYHSPGAGSKIGQQQLLLIQEVQGSMPNHELE